MLEKKTFNGGLDSDSEDRYIVQGDYRFLMNGRNGVSDKEAVGTIENVRGNTLIEYTHPSGTNKVIGAYGDKINRVVIYFVWNSNSDHSILEFDPTTRTITTILQSSVLAFEQDRNIKGVNRIGDLLKWVDGNAPRDLNIDRAKSNGYPSPFTEQFIDAIKYAPTCPPTVKYISAPDTLANNLHARLFQFRYKWVYVDGEESAWSAISSVPLPEFEHVYYPFGENPEGSDNAIEVTVETGSGTVKRIKIAVRVVTNSLAPGDFTLAKDLDKDDIGIASDSILNYVYDGDATEIPISLSDSNKLYDFLPLKAETQELIDGNRITYGNITENYDNIDVDVSITPIKTFTPGGEIPTIVPTFSTDSEVNILSAGSLKTPSQALSGSISEGVITTMSVAIRLSIDYWRKETFSYVAQGGDTLSDVLDAFVALISGSTSLNPTPFEKKISVGTTLIPVTDQWLTSGVSLTGAVANLQTVAYRSGNSIEIETWSNNWQVNGAGGLTNGGKSKGGYTGVGFAPTYIHNIISASVNAPPTFSFKRGSNHPIGIVYYDKANRSGLVQEDDGMSVFVPYFAEGDVGGAVMMEMEINHQPPEWAVKYQVVYSGSVSTGRFLQINTGLTSATSDGLFTIVLDTIEGYNDYIVGGKLSYDFAEGDRVRVIRNTSGDQPVDLIDVEVKSFDGGTNTITVKGSPTFTMTDATLIEIYSPNQSADRELYYEMGVCNEVLFPGTQRRAHAGSNLAAGIGFNDTDQIAGLNPATIYLYNVGDVVMKLRDFQGAGGDGTFYIEDYSYSDIYTSSVWSKGRPNLIDRQVNQEQKKTTIYYSDSLIPSTNVNGLSSFTDLSFEEYDSRSGAIKKLYAEDGRLLVFQELKVGQVMVNEDVLFNNDGTPNGVVGQQNTVLGKMNYYAGEYGIGCNPESFDVYGNNKYFIDAERGAVLRLGANGITPISDTKMVNFFKERMKKCVDSGTEFKVYGVYDVRFDEYVLAFDEIIVVDNSQKVPTETLIPGETIAFSEGKTRWVTFYDFLPENMVNSAISLVTFKDGGLYVHNDSDTYNNFYGAQGTTLLRFTSNEAPSDIKFYTSIFTESVGVLSMPSATNQFGQKTSLTAVDFEEREGVFYANFLRDENTPNLALPILEGDSMRCHTMEIELESDSTSYERITAVGVRSSRSMLTNS